MKIQEQPLILILDNAISPSITVGGNLVVNGGILNFSNGIGTPSLDLSGNLVVATGATITESGTGSGTIAFTNSIAQTISTNGSVLNSIILTINNTAGVSLLTDLTFGGTINVLAGAVFTASTNITQIAGTFNANNGTTTLSGNYSMNAGTFNGTIGTLTFDAGSTYIHNMNAGAVPFATWHVTSLCSIEGTTNNDPTPANFLQTFGNFVWDCTCPDYNCKFCRKFT
ncbi:MAG: hypothetical protein MZU79_02255 [Anaerotruncus sp.]|nr:hypothetical protein [Anaerotruncus sp.]